MTNREIWEKYGDKMVNINGRNATLIVIDEDGDLVIEYENRECNDNLWEDVFCGLYHYKHRLYGNIPNTIIPYNRVDIYDLIKSKFVNIDFIKF